MDEQPIDEERLARAIAAIDASNADDPERTRVGGGESEPKQLAHARLASDWILKFRPAASPALRLAARAHHLRRWEILRADYPAGRPGYLRWRRDLQKHHARVAAAILEREEVDPETIRRVSELIRKRGLGVDSDSEVQTLEDALCLVFLETQLADLAARLESGKMRDILRKTLPKMSAQGRRAAAELELRDSERDLLARAVAEFEAAS